MLRRLLDPFLEQHERWVLWVPVAIAIGVGGYFALPTEPPLWAGPLALAIFAVLTRRRLWALPLLLAVLGFSAAQLRAWSVETPQVTRKTAPLTLEGRVRSIEPQAQGARVTLTDLGEGLPHAVRLVSRVKQEPPRAGDIVSIRAVLLPPPQPVAPGAYDFQRHLFFLGIGATGFTLGPFQTLKAHEGGYFLADLRRAMSARIHAAMGNADAAAITTALLYGEEQGISKPMYETIRRAGLAHLIAISGLQITLVTGFFFFAVRAGLAAIPALALHWPVKKVAAVAALVGAVFYLMLIGESVPAARAVVMVCAAMCAVLIDRDPLTLRMAAFSACVILLLRPESLFGPSFQLSFAAVVALISFYEAVKDRFFALPGEKFAARAGAYLLGSLATTLVATLATAPVALYHFLSTPLLPGLAANLVAVPLSSFVTMPAGIIGCLLMPLGLEAVPLKIAEWSVIAIMKTAALAASWPYALFHVDAWPQPLFVTMAFGGLWLFLWRGRLRLFGLLPLALGGVLLFFAPRADILVSDDGKVFAARAADGRLLFSPGRAGKFIREQWTLRDGGAGTGEWPAPPDVLCDAQACLYRAKGVTASFVSAYTALAQDCASADIVISWLFIRRAQCPGPKVLIDGRTLRREGAVAIYIDASGRITVRHAGTERGQRRWSQGWKAEKSESRTGP